MNQFISGRDAEENANMQVLILADIPTWVINRICDSIILNMPRVTFVKRYDQSIPVDEFRALADRSDLVHFLSWERLFRFTQFAPKYRNKTVLTVQSHRYVEQWLREFLPNCAAVTCVNPRLKRELMTKFNCDSTYIPLAIDDMFFRNKRVPVVGYAGQRHEYKGVHLIEQACKELNFQYLPAYADIEAEKMPEYYKKIDCYVCASVEEGFATPVREALAMNIPVISTDTGAVEDLDITKVERSVEGIKKGLLRLFGSQLVQKYNWPDVCRQLLEVYETVKRMEQGGT
jgi:glycosyltransferase involved in cell wall biosynthesis